MPHNNTIQNEECSRVEIRNRERRKERESHLTSAFSFNFLCFAFINCFLLASVSWQKIKKGEKKRIREA
jgi:hypothetical protein